MRWHLVAVTCSMLTVLRTVLLTVGTSLLWYASAAWTPDDYPNPLTDARACSRPGRKSLICDPDRVLAEGDRNNVEAILKAIRYPFPPYAAARCASHKIGTPRGFEVGCESRPPKTCPHACCLFVLGASVALVILWN